MQSLEYFLIGFADLSSTHVQVWSLLYALLGAIGIIFFIYQYALWKISKRKPIQKDTPAQKQQATPSSDEYGKIVDSEHVIIAKKMYKYFVLKENASQQEKLPQGTIVCVLKKSEKEAHVKPATEEDILSIKRRGLNI